MVNYKTKIYVFGGHNGNTALNDLHVFDIAKGIWLDARTSGVPPSPRFFHSATVIGGKMYIFGGSRLLETISDLHVLDLDTLTWSQPVTYGCQPGSRYSHSAFAWEGRMVVFGGLETGKLKYSNEVYTLDANTLTWSREETSGFTVGRKECRTAVLLGNSIYVFAWALFPVCLETHILDLTTMTWSNVVTDGPYPESEGFTACTMGTSIMVFGGKELSSPYSAHSRVVNDLFAFCTKTMTWSKVENNSESFYVPAARYSHSACVWNGKMFVFGGCSGYRKELDDLHCFSWHHSVMSLTDMCLTVLVERAAQTLPNVTSLPEDLFHLLFQKMAQHRKLTLLTLPLFLKNPSFASSGEISLAVCGHIVDDDWLHTIAQMGAPYTHRWETLDISNCKLVSNKGLRKLTVLGNLKTLMADVESRITYDGVKMFKDHLPGVDVVLCRQSQPIFKVN